MRVLIVGAGFVGQELSSRLVAQGHEVVATTTTPTKVEALRSIATEVKVLRGSDAGAVADAAVGCDAVVIAAGPAAARAMSAEERAASYQDVLVDTARGVTEGLLKAGVTGPVVVLSSLSVYGAAADHLEEVTELAPLTTNADPSPQCFQQMEAIYRESLGSAACIFRCADIYGGEDPPIEVKVRMAHEVLNGSVPFRGEALFYRINVADVIAAIEHAIAARLSGTFNLTHAEVPATCAERFDSIGKSLGFPPLRFRGEIEAPAKPISVAALAETGFEATHTAVEA